MRHAFALTLFAGLSVLWTFPLVANLTTHIPGPSAGDNVTFLWNFWWMRTAIEQRTDFLVTPFICAPWGVNLTLHTHTALPAFIGATLGRGLSIVAALNLLLLAGIALNGACAYWLAWRTTRDHAAATVAGCVFGCCPFLAGHLQGHFNLVHAWTIPLFATAAIESLGGNRARWALFAGFIAGLTAYVDYYFVVYEFVLFALLMIWQTRDWTTDRVDGPRRFRAAARAAGALALVFLAVIVTIRITGGQTFRVLGQRVSLHGTFNALQLFWICVVAALLFSTSIRLRLVPRVVDPVSALVQPLLLVVLAFCVTASPILWHAASMALQGDYEIGRAHV